MKINVLLGSVFFGFVLWTGLLPLQGAMVHFGPAQPITTCDPMLDQPGTLVGAAQWSNPGSTYAVATTNGSIPFAPGGIGGTGGTVACVSPNSTVSTYGYAGNTGNAALNSALAGFAFTNINAPIVITLKGLTAGQTYAAQIFSVRTSGPGTSASAYYTDSFRHLSATFQENSNSYFLATFTADASTQQITLKPSTSSDSVFVNALVLRRLPYPVLQGGAMQFSLARPIGAVDPMLDQAGAVVGGAQWSNLGSTYAVTTAKGLVSFAPGGTGGIGGTVACVDQTSTVSTYGYAGNTGSAALNSALAGFAFTVVNNPIVITLKGLTAGQAYSAQLFSVRPSWNSNVYFVDPVGNISSVFPENSNSYFLATFVASGSTQQLRICPATGADSVFVNALVLRSTGAPQKTTWRGFDIQTAAAFTFAAMQDAKQTFHANLIRYHLPVDHPVTGTTDADCEALFQSIVTSPDFTAGLDAANSLGMAVAICLPPTGTHYLDPALAQQHDLSGFWDDDANLATLCADWMDVAQACAGRPSQQIWYDLLNETEDRRDNPSYPHNWPAWAQAAIDAIRTVDATHKIVIEPGPDLAHWAQSFPLLDDANLVYSFHTYNPTGYTYQGLPPQAEPSPSPDWPGTYDLVPSGTGSALWNLAQIQSYVAPAVAFSGRNPFIPVFVGEFSVVAWAPHAAYYLQDSMTAFEQYGWDWTYHAFRENNTIWSLEYTSTNATNGVHATMPTDRARAVTDYLGRNFEVVNVDFNNLTSAGSSSPTQARYQPFSVLNTGTVHGPIAKTYTGLDPAFTQGGAVSVTLASGSTAAGTGILYGSDRGGLSVNKGGYAYGSLFVNGPLYEDVVIAPGTSTTLWVTVSGLKPNTAYNVKFYLYDNAVTSAATATFTNETDNEGAPSATIAFNGGYAFTSATANDLFSTMVSAASDSDGDLVFKETLSGGISGQAELGGLQVLHP